MEKLSFGCDVPDSPVSIVVDGMPRKYSKVWIDRVFPASAAHLRWRHMVRSRIFHQGKTRHVLGPPLAAVRPMVLRKPGLNGPILPPLSFAPINPRASLFISLGFARNLAFLVHAPAALVITIGRLALSHYRARGARTPTSAPPMPISKLVRTTTRVCSERRPSSRVTPQLRCHRFRLPLYEADDRGVR